jgi:Fe-S-cluster containining protein
MKKRMILGWGKLRRMFLVYIRPAKVNTYLTKRNGECARCGSCCELMFHCPALTKKDGLASCKIHDKRSRVCSTYPLNERDLKDRDLVNKTRKCGFSFNKRQSNPER